MGLEPVLGLVGQVNVRWRPGQVGPSETNYAAPRRQVLVIYFNFLLLSCCSRRLFCSETIGSGIILLPSSLCSQIEWCDLHNQLYCFQKKKKVKRIVLPLKKLQVFFLQNSFFFFFLFLNNAIISDNKPPEKTSHWCWVAGVQTLEAAPGLPICWDWYLG